MHGTRAQHVLSELSRHVPSTCVVTWGGVVRKAAGRMDRLPGGNYLRKEVWSLAL